MNIRNTEAFMASHWDWTPLNQGVFLKHRSKIRVGDADRAFDGDGSEFYPKGMVERGGRFLFLETKRPGDEMQYGQRRAYAQLAAIPGIKVLVITGLPNRPVSFRDFPNGLEKTGGWPELIRWVEDWYLSSSRKSTMRRAA